MSSLKKFNILLAVGNTLVGIVILYPLLEPEHRGAGEIALRALGALVVLGIAVSGLRGITAPEPVADLAPGPAPEPEPEPAAAADPAAKDARR